MSRSAETPDEHTARTGLLDSLRTARHAEAEGLFAAICASDPNAIPASAVSQAGSGSSGPNFSATEIHLAPPTQNVASTTEPKFEHVDRLRNKVLQLGRMDRPRPPPESRAENASLHRRLTRVQHRRQQEAKKEQIAIASELSVRDGRSKSSRNRVEKTGKRKRRSSEHLDSRPTDKLSTSDLRHLATEPLLDQIHAVWVEYMQDLLRLRDAATLRSLSLTAEQLALTPDTGSSAAAPLPLSGKKPPVADGVASGSACLLGMPSQLSGGAAGTLSKADWTGAAVYVADSRCTDMRGIRGIVLVETEHTVVVGTPVWMDSRVDEESPVARFVPSSSGSSKSRQKKKIYPLVRRAYLSLELHCTPYSDSLIGR